MALLCCVDPSFLLCWERTQAVLHLNVPTGNLELNLIVYKRKFCHHSSIEHYCIFHWFQRHSFISNVSFAVSVAVRPNSFCSWCSLDKICFMVCLHMQLILLGYSNLLHRKTTLSRHLHLQSFGSKSGPHETSLLQVYWPCPASLQQPGGAGGFGHSCLAARGTLWKPFPHGAPWTPAFLAWNSQQHVSTPFYNSVWKTYAHCMMAAPPPDHAVMIPILGFSLMPWPVCFNAMANVA